MILFTTLQQGFSSYSCKWKAGFKSLEWWFPVYFIIALVACYFAWSGQIEHFFTMILNSFLTENLHPATNSSSSGTSSVSHALEIVLPMFSKTASLTCSFFLTTRIFSVIFFPQKVAQELRKEEYSEYFEAEKQKQLHIEEKRRLNKALPESHLQRSHKRLWFNLYPEIFKNRNIFYFNKNTSFFLTGAQILSILLIYLML